MSEERLDESDLALLRLSIELAKQARAHGNHPFGAVLADDKGRIIEKAENTVMTGRDVTNHAEMNLLRQAAQRITPEILARCTVFASAEPCPMCAGAIFWNGIPRVVFALSSQRLYEFAPGAPGTKLPTSRDILKVEGVKVLGPFLEEEAKVVQEGFWKGHL